jgi:TRAP-type C4-dicarboxylate transport system substrate-binding protein
MVLTRIHRRILALLLICLPLCPATPAHARVYTLKFATLAPSGSTWMNILEDWAEEVRERSDGRLLFKFYPGGVQGDEPEIVKKMRFNLLQGGAFSGNGIGLMYSPARVMELPFLFDTHAEIDHVRQQLMPSFREGFHDAGYELLGWMEIGFVHMFSREPIDSLEAMKSHRVWLWQGDPLGQAFFDASGITPVPLSIVDVYTSLSTGLIDTVYCTPLASIALQWFTKTRYVSEVSLTNAIGGLVVTRRFFDRLPPDLQALLRETGDVAGEQLILETRADNEDSLEELVKQGLKLVPPGEGLQPADLVALRDKAAEGLMASNYLPRALVTRVRELLAAFRKEEQQVRSAADETTP